MVVLGTAAAGPALGAQGQDGAGHGTRVSTAALPVGIHSLAYRGTTADAMAEQREIRAASRNALRARSTAAGDANQAGAAPQVTEATLVDGVTGIPATATGAAAGRTAKGARPAQKAGRPRQTTPRTGPGRQRATTPRAATSRNTWPRTTNPRSTFPRIAAPAVGAGSGGGVVGFALAQVGKGYGFGSVGPERFDCSGLVAAAYRQIGISLPHQTGALAGVGRPVGRGELRPGDLVFPSAGHVGIYVGGGRIVHASTERGGVKISPIYAFRFARRIS